MADETVDPTTDAARMLLGQVRVMKQQLAALSAQADAMEQQLVPLAMYAAQTRVEVSESEPPRRGTKRYLKGDPLYGPHASGTDKR